MTGLTLAAPSEAASFYEDLQFSADGQSQWSSVPALSFNTGGSRFIGVPGFSEGASIGGAGCALFACAGAGAELGFTVGGRTGNTYDIRLDSGSLTISVPQRVSFTLPDPSAIRIGRPFDSTTAVLPAGPLLQTHIPTNLRENPLFSDTFRVDVPSLRTDPFNIVFNPLKANVESDLCLGFGVDDLGNRLRTGYIRLSAGGRYDVLDAESMYGLLQLSDDCTGRFQILDQFGRP